MTHLNNSYSYIYMHTNINMEVGYSELLSDVSLIMPFFQALQSNAIKAHIMQITTVSAKGEWGKCQNTLKMIICIPLQTFS